MKDIFSCLSYRATTLDDLSALLHAAEILTEKYPQVRHIRDALKVILSKATNELNEHTLRNDELATSSTTEIDLFLAERDVKLIDFSRIVFRILRNLEASFDYSFYYETRERLGVCRQIAIDYYNVTEIFVDIDSIFDNSGFENARFTLLRRASSAVNDLLLQSTQLKPYVRFLDDLLLHFGSSVDERRRYECLVYAFGLGSLLDVANRLNDHRDAIHRNERPDTNKVLAILKIMNTQRADEDLPYQFRVKIDNWRAAAIDFDKTSRRGPQWITHGLKLRALCQLSNALDAKRKALVDKLEADFGSLAVSLYSDMGINDVADTYLDNRHPLHESPIKFHEYCDFQSQSIDGKICLSSNVFNHGMQVFFSISTQAQIRKLLQALNVTDDAATKNEIRIILKGTNALANPEAWVSKLERLSNKCDRILSDANTVGEGIKSEPLRSKLTP